MSPPVKPATAAYFAATEDGAFDHQRDAYEEGYEQGERDLAARVRRAALSWATSGDPAALECAQQLAEVLAPL